MISENCHFRQNCNQTLQTKQVRATNLNDLKEETNFKELNEMQSNDKFLHKYFIQQK
jgi:hypothetical protein